MASLTDVVGSVAGGLEGVPRVGFLGKPKVCQLQNSHIV